MAKFFNAEIGLKAYRMPPFFSEMIRWLVEWVVIHLLCSLDFEFGNNFVNTKQKELGMFDFLVLQEFSFCLCFFFYSCASNCVWIYEYEYIHIKQFLSLKTSTEMSRKKTSNCIWRSKAATNKKTKTQIIIKTH